MGTGGDAAEGPSSLRYAFADPITANLEGAVTFEAPELPEETLMEVGTSQGLVGGNKTERNPEVRRLHVCSRGGGLLPKAVEAGLEKARPAQHPESPGHV